jgi:hypothetical protein
VILVCWTRMLAHPLFTAVRESGAPELSAWLIAV